MGRNVVLVKNNLIKDELEYNGVTLLTYSIEYPEFISPCYRTCLRKVNKFYEDQALGFKKYCETELFGMAIAQYIDDIENNYPIRVYEAVQVYEVTYLRACIISVYSDRYAYTGGAHGNTIRDSQTWNLRNCALLGLNQLVSCFPNYRTFILAVVEAQIKINPDIYFENYKELIAETFNENSFFSSPEGIVIYYQQYEIAPYSSGIREFLIPYSDCAINPRKLCCTRRGY